MSREDFDEALAPYLSNTNALQHAAQGISLGLGVHDIDQSEARVSGWLSRAYDPLKAQNSRSETADMAEQLQGMLRPLLPLPPPFSNVFERLSTGNGSFSVADVRSLGRTSCGFDRRCSARDAQLHRGQ